MGKGKMTISQVQGSPAMELVEGKIQRRSVSDLNAVGGETSLTLFNLFCSNVSKQDARVCSPFNHSFCDCVPTYDSFCIYHFAFFYKQSSSRAPMSKFTFWCRSDMTL